MSTLDDYLDRLGRELQASPEEAEEVLREVRSHLELAVCDMERNGTDGAACLGRALERFGAAERIGRELRQVHGRATWQEAGLAALSLLLFGMLPSLPRVPAWVAPLALAAATALAWRARWPLWWWAWLGWLPFAVPGAPGDLLWGSVAYVVILLLVSRRDWLEATLAIYPLPTAWAFHRVALASNEVQHVGWGATVLGLLGLGMALVWAALLARTLRTPSGTARIGRVLEGQVVVFLLNGLTVVVARLWPTYPDPYPFTWRHFLFFTLPYALFNGLPFLLFFALTSLPAVLALVQARARRRPPSRPVWGG
jgi:hypothetical protein